MTEPKPKLSERLLWQAFVDLYHQAIFRFAWGMLGSREEAEDVVQEVFLRAHQNLNITEGNYDSAESKGWLYAAARNICIDRHRRWKRWTGVMNALRLKSPQIAESGPAGPMLRLIQILPIRQRQVLLLRQWHGFSTNETAALLRIGEGSVKSHLSRAIERIKRELKQEGEI